MIFEGDRSVVDLIKRRSAGNFRDNSKLLLIIDSGLMKCAYRVGACVALEEAGLSEVFDDVVGVSGGAITASYLLSKDMKLGSTVLYEECTSNDFLNFRRLNRITDVTYIDGVLRGNTGKRINVEGILSQKTKLYLSVTKHADALPKLILSNSAEDFFVAIKASIAMPGICGEVVNIDGVDYVDGAFGAPHVAGHAVDVLKPTHILWITNQEKSDLNVSIIERFLYMTLYRNRMPSALRESSSMRRKARRYIIEVLKERSDINLAVVWGDGSIGSLERSPEVVKRTIERSRLWWHELLAK